MISKSPDAVVGDSLCFFWMGDKVLDLFLEIGEISFDFNEILIVAVGSEEIVVVLDPLQFVDEDDAMTDLPVFQGAGIASTWGLLERER